MLFEGFFLACIKWRFSESNALILLFFCEVIKFNYNYPKRKYPSKTGRPEVKATCSRSMDSDANRLSSTLTGRGATPLRFKGQNLCRVF